MIFNIYANRLELNDSAAAGDDSPKLDAQMTARVDKMLLEYKKKTTVTPAAAATGDENASPNR